MRSILRYRTSKPDSGHFSFQLSEAAVVLAYSEHWHSEKGWEVNVDILDDTRGAKVRRSFFLCNAGDNLDFLGDYPDSYFVAKCESYAYTSFLFETSHLSETQRELGVVQPKRYLRSRPRRDEMSTTERKYADKAADKAAASKNGSH